MPLGDVLEAQQVDGHSAVVMKRKNGKVICKIPNGEHITVIRDAGVDYFVRWKDKKGLVKKANTVAGVADEEEDEEENAHEDAGTGSTELSMLNGVLEAQQVDGHSAVVMKGNDGKEICKIPNGERIALISEEGSDCLVCWNDNEGLVKKYNTKPVFAYEEEDEEQEEDEKNALRRRA